MDEQTKRRIQAARNAGWSEDQIQRMVLIDQQKSQQTQQVTRPPQEKTLLNKVGDAEILGVKVLPAATGTLGAIGGFAVGGPVGAIAGGAAGASLGEGLRQTIDSKEGYQPLEIAEEGAYGAAGELGGQIIGRVGGKVLKPVVKKVASAVGVGAPKVANKVASGFLKETPTQWLKAAEAGIDPNEMILKYVPQLGTTLDELLGPVTRGRAFGHSGTIQGAIKGAEETIQGISKQAGKNIRVMGDDLLQSLLIEKKAMSRQLGSTARMQALSGIIEEAQKKYAKGITVNQALDILRSANERFGASIIDDTADAVATAAQKLEGNVMRRTLRKMFPVMGDALDTQAELITLREILKGTAAKAATGGFKLGRLDLSRPGTLFDALVSSGPAIGATSRIAKAAAGDYAKLTTGIGLVKKFGQQAGARVAMEAGGGLAPNEPDFSSPASVLPGSPSASVVEGSGSTGMEFSEDPNLVAGGDSDIPTKDQFKEAYFNAIMAGDTKAANMIKEASNFLHGDEGVGVTLSDTAIQSITDIEAGIRGIETIEGMITKEGSQTGPVSGQAAKIPWATDAKTLQAEIDRVRQKVGKALEGGVLRKEDEEKYKKILPTITDTEEVALNKLSALKQELNADLNRFVNLQTSHGKGASQPASPSNLRFAEENPETFYNSPNDVDFNTLYP